MRKMLVVIAGLFSLTASSIASAQFIGSCNQVSNIRYRVVNAAVAGKAWVYLDVDDGSWYLTSLSFNHGVDIKVGPAGTAPGTWPAPASKRYDGSRWYDYGNGNWASSWNTWHVLYKGLKVGKAYDVWIRSWCYGPTFNQGYTYYHGVIRRTFGANPGAIGTL